MKKIIPIMLLMAALLTGCVSSSTEPLSDGAVVGTGENSFVLEVVDKDSNIQSFEIRTDETTVGDALIENSFIAGEDGPYGLYVKSVNGIIADYDTDKTYWAFYVDGVYANQGVESTKIEPESTYMFKIEEAD